MSNFNYGKHTMSMATTSSAGAQAAAISLPIEGMTCASCVGRVEAALAKVEGVASVSVNLATERADIRLNRPVDRMALIQAIEKVGYDVPQGTIEPGDRRHDLRFVRGPRREGAQGGAGRH